MLRIFVFLVFLIHQSWAIVLSEVIQKALEKNPELSALKQELQSANLSLSAEKQLFLPEFFFTYRYTYNFEKQTFNIPIFSGLQVESAKKSYQTFQAGLRYTVFDGFARNFSVALASSNLKSKEFFILLLAFLIPSALVLKQPDLGTAITYFFILFSALFFFGLKLRYFIGLFVLLLLLSPLLWHFLKDYQKKRILAVLDPYEDYMGSGYQLIQSVIAVGSGGLFGKGFLKGTQSHLLFLPEKHTDFIFSVIAEEMGFLVSFLLITVFFVMAWRFLSYVPRADIKEEVLFLGAFSTFLIFEVFVNFAMTMGFMPVVGIPLPFVSYGGSSTLTFSLMLGTALSIVKELRQKTIRFSND